MRKMYLLGLICAASAAAQSLSVGILGGAPFTDVVKAEQSNDLSFAASSSNFVIGPALQVGLPLHLRIEGDVLYRPYSFSVSGSGTTTSVSASDWRFPVLLQYRFELPVIKPFIEGGLSFDHLSNISTAASVITSGTGQLVQQSNAGVVLGGGVDLKIPLVRLSAELRYTHQGSADFRDLSNVNQAEFLVGIHF